MRYIELPCIHNTVRTRKDMFIIYAVATVYNFIVTPPRQHSSKFVVVTCQKACSVFQDRAEKPLWTTEDYEKVTKKLTEAPHHAVAKEDMQVMLGRRGDEVLRSFVLHNVLHVRHAKDLRNRVDAHGNNLLDIPADPEGRKMITALSPAQQFAMNRLVAELGET